MVSKLFRNVPMITSLEVSPLLEFQLVATGSAGVEPGAGARFGVAEGMQSVVRPPQSKERQRHWGK
jgi:hypothetical protein